VLIHNGQTDCLITIPPLYPVQKSGIYSIPASPQNCGWVFISERQFKALLIIIIDISQKPEHPSNSVNYNKITGFNEIKKTSQ
jgi:hypothetical protein